MKSKWKRFEDFLLEIGENMYEWVKSGWRPY